MPYREADQLNTYLFHEGTSRNAYEYMGAHATEVDGAITSLSYSEEETVKRTQAARARLRRLFNRT